MKPRKLLFVTGAGGFLGRHFLALARRRGWRLRCLARRLPPGSWPGVEWVKGDLSKDGRWTARLKDCDTVLHLAACPLELCQEDPVLAEEVIVHGLRRLMEAMSRRGVGRLIMASTGEVYGIPKKIPVGESLAPAPQSVYGFLKACADLVAMHAGPGLGIQVCILRFFNLYGRALHGPQPPTVLNLFADRILKGQPVILHASRRNSRDFVHVKDAARALALAVGHPEAEGIFNIGSGRETTLLDAAQRLARRAGVPLRVDFRPREGRLRRAAADIRRARRELGFRPSVPLDRGLRELLRVLG